MLDIWQETSVVLTYLGTYTVGAYLMRPKRISTVAPGSEAWLLAAREPAARSPSIHYGTGIWHPVYL
jgi:hypothetical protein